MLWDLIRDFYVINIFGGVTSDESYYFANLGWFSNSDLSADYYNSSELLVNIYDYKMGFADWLSTIATIITIVAILLFCVFIIKKIIGIMFRLATGSSAF